ncbi:MAG TPA: hypothetical protein VFU13_11665 [Steroidobacteraceae bacterium]|nr:hypothetical protein [Steroidobacteraceae bacterium]
MSSTFDGAAREALALSTAERSRRIERRFFTGMAVALAVACFAGFAPSYYLKSHIDTAALPLRVHVHGAAFSLWMLLLITQTSLIASGRAHVHRKLGIVGGVLAIVMVATAAAVIWGRGTTPTPAMPHDFVLRFLALSIVALLAFSSLIAMALHFRRNAAIHKRLMMLATTVMAGAAVHRLLIWLFGPTVGPLAFFGATDLFIVALCVFDWSSRRKLHPATLWGGAAVVGSQVAALLLAGSDTWLNFARWATGT